MALSFKRKLVWASFAAAVTFSGFHLINLLGTPVTVVSQQLFYSLAMGVFLAASYFATNNLLVPLGIHLEFTSCWTGDLVIITSLSQVPG